MAVTVSLINMKGGVGKTTIASQLAYAASDDGLKVLAIDLDPQSNLSQSMMGPRDYVDHLKNNRPTVAQILEGYIPPGGDLGSPRPIDLADVMVKNPGPWRSLEDGTLDLIPSRLELSRTLRNPTGKERRLARSLTRVSDQYDLIIIDCAPTDSILTDVAYFASRYVIVPVKPEFMATIGLPLLARSIQAFQAENDDHKIEIAGLIINYSSSYSEGPEGRQSITDVEEEAGKRGWQIFSHRLEYSASYPAAAREGTPIDQTPYARESVRNKFAELKDEILEKLGIERRTP